MIRLVLNFIVHRLYLRAVWQCYRPPRKSATNPEEDVHARVMSHYPQVPSWWYWTLFLVTLAMSIAAIEAYPTELPVWALFIALSLAAVLVLPIGLVQAKTNFQVGLNVLVSGAVSIAFDQG